MKRQFLEFTTTKSRFKGVYCKHAREKNVWKGKMILTIIILVHMINKEILAIIWNLMAIQFGKKAIITNFHPRHYTYNEANSLTLGLPKNKKVIEASDWDLIK